jgi:hypothetical protein
VIASALRLTDTRLQVDDVPLELDARLVFALPLPAFALLEDALQVTLAEHDDVIESTKQTGPHLSASLGFLVADDPQ